MKARELRAKSRFALSGNWGVAILTTFVAGLLGVFGAGGGSGSGRVGEASERFPALEEFLYSPEGRVVLAVIGVLATAAAIYGLCKFIIGGAVTLGYRSFTLNLVDGKEAKFSDLFSKFDTMFAKGFAMQLLMAIYIALWTMLLIIPGIIKAYAYSMTPYILLEHPEMKASEAITASRMLMNGNKWRLFCLKLSFIGWGLLCLLTFGIGYLWLTPYREVSEAAFYRQICAERIGQFD